MNHFTKDNTQGFSQRILDKMNGEMEVELLKHFSDQEREMKTDDHLQNEQWIAERIFNKYC